MIDDKRAAAAAELELAIEAERAGDFKKALSHLMKAHGLSQLFRRDHARAHWRMLAFALRRHRLSEALNQFVLAFGAATYVRLSRARPGAISERPVTASRQPTCD